MKTDWSKAEEVTPAYKGTSMGMGTASDIDMRVADTVQTTPENKPLDIPGLVAKVNARFEQIKNRRLDDEQRWIRAYRNFRGRYGPDMVWREHEKSHVFVKVTKTKVLAAYGQLIDVVFGNNNFPIGVEPSQLPEGVADMAYINPNEAPDQKPESLMPDYGYPGDNKDLAPGAKSHSLLSGLGAKIKNLLGQEPTNVHEGVAPDKQNMIQLEPALISAKKMEKTIKDQLDDSDAATHLRFALMESCMLGAGALKGPFNYDKAIHKWQDVMGEKVYVPYAKTVPRIESVSIWNIYPDMDATTLGDCDCLIERHIMSRSQLRDLVNRPLFNKDAILNVIDQGPNYVPEWWEAFLDDTNMTALNRERFQVLEFWGIMDRDLAEEAGIDIPDEFTDMNELQINVWICGTHIIRSIVNPFTPARIPYLIVPYEINPYHIFGIGVAENMEDTQAILNGHARMAIDNLALAGNVILEVDSTFMTPGTDMKLYPGKIFERQSGQPGNMINAIRFQDTSQNHMQLFDRFRQIADEQTGIPSYSHGQTGIQSTTRTASGMSMLMGASALNIKTVVKNLDDYVLGPLGTAFYHWNMQFNPDPEIVGDLEVKARGMASLMQREVRSQRLQMFAQMVAGNPMIAPLINWTYFLQQAADSLELDREKIIASPEDAKLYAFIMKDMMGKNGQGSGAEAPASGQQSGMGQGTGMGQMGAPSDTQGSGGGTIGTGSVSMPGTPSFSANTGNSPR